MDGPKVPLTARCLTLHCALLHCILLHCAPCSDAACALQGIFTAQYVEIEADFMDHYRNQGGFDMIGASRALELCYTSVLWNCATHLCSGTVLHICALEL